MIKKNFLIPFLLLLGIVSNSYSQNHWKKTTNQSIYQQKQQVLARDNFPTKYTLMDLDYSKFQNQLLQANTSRSRFSIELPDAKGNLERFNIIETPTLAPGLSAKFPMIKTYTAYGIDNSHSTAKITLGTNGLHVVISAPEKSTVYIDPLSNSKKEYLVYRKIDLENNSDNFTCEVENQAQRQVDNHISHRNANDGKLRTYRLALTCTGEYSQFHLNRQGIAATAPDDEKKAAVLSAMNTTIARVNEVYERDLAVRMVIVDNNEDLIFLDPNTDDLSNSNANALINESQVKCDNIIGDANYDIGHAFSTGGGGLAQLQSVCRSGNKARGITGQGQPINDPFDIDYVAHEVGHQFGATHTQNNSCNRTNSTAVEPGSASTIMGYAGICAPNVQNNSDDHFHAVSIAQMWSHIQNTAGCPAETDTGNAAPTANAGSDYSIPKSTPFVLRGEATDANGTDNLTYNWEQTDTEVGTMPPASTNTGGPMFRSLPSKTSPNRYMPDLTTVIAGNTASTWEVVPSVAREMNFALTVRDNHAGGGSSARDDVKVTVVDTDPFTVTSHTTTSDVGIGVPETITWNKGETDIDPINCSLVNIRLSIDGGQTFPILLKENTPNDGSEEIVMPNHETDQARIMVEAADNLFYAVNSANLNLVIVAPTFFISNNNETKAICEGESTVLNYTLNFNFINGFSEAVAITSENVPAGVNVTFSNSNINSNTDVVMSLSNLATLTQNTYEVTVKGTSASEEKTITVPFKVNGTNFSTVTLNSPTNNATDYSIAPTFEWVEDSNANAYTIIVSTENSLANPVINEVTSSNSYDVTTTLAANTTYYWAVKPKNDCGEGTFSDTFSFTTEIPEYCASTFTNGANDSEFIKNVTFNTINNDSGNDTGDGYEDYTNIETNVHKTLSYDISVTFDTGGYQDHCYVFIDWNGDYQFNKDNERYDLGSRTEDVATVTMNIPVPNDAVLGKTRMRVIIEYDDPNNNYGDGPCDGDHLTEWGETEDYTLVVKEAPSPDFTLINTSDSISICNTATDEVSFNLDYQAIFGFTEEVTFTTSNTPTNANIAFSNTSLSSNGSTILTLSNLNNSPTGDYNITITGTSASITKDINILFNINDEICKSQGNTASQISTTLVQFADIDNTSTKENGYSDFRTISTEVIKGEQYELKVNVNNDGGNTVKTYAWVDWNQNCLFDNDEEYVLTSNSANITIPNTAQNGSTVLRVITKKASEGNPIACQLDFNGETEDYTINIIPFFKLSTTENSNSICNQAINEVNYSFNYETFNGFNEDVILSAENVPTNATVTFSQTTINSNGNYNVNFGNLNNVANGTYTITVKATGSLEKSFDIILSVNDEHCNSTGNTTSQISTTLVQFGDIDNTSTKENGYSDFKTISTEVIKGNEYELKVNVNNAGANVSTYAWIDWNQNCLFDDSENYDLNINGSTGTINITVPDDALTGSTTLRVSTKNTNSGAPQSCELDFDGEVEDYTIKLTPVFTLSNIDESASICNQAINEYTFAFKYETFNDFNEDVSLSTENAPANATVTFSEDTINTNGNYSVTLSDLSSVVNGDYQFTIKATVGSTEKTIEMLLSVDNNGCKATGNTASQISITQVNFSTIDNSSTKTNGYDDYTDMIAYVSRSDAYELIVDSNNDGATTNTYAFIDWNQNCMFEDNEMYSIENGNTNITIPEAAVLGETKLRIVTKESSLGTPKGCELNFNGEVEDYTVSIDESYATNQNLFSDLKIGKIPVESSNMSVTINFKVKDKDLTTVSLFDLSGRLLKTEAYTIQSSRFIKEFTMGSASSGIYLLQIQNGGKHITRNIVIK